MAWSGLDIHVKVVDITNQTNPNVAPQFGTIYITGKIRTDLTCTSNCTYTSMTFEYDLGTVVSVKQWQTLAASFSPTTFFIYNGTYPPTNSGTHPSTAQWNDVISQVTNLTIDASLQTKDSAEVIAIDELGIGYQDFSVPEPQTYIHLAIGLIGIIAGRKYLLKP
jgi:hypothetical protein